MSNMYVRLFHGRKTVEEDMDDWGTDGPVLGPFEWVHIVYGTYIHMGLDGGTVQDLQWKREYEGCLLYDGVYYGDISIWTKDYTTITCEEAQKLPEYERGPYVRAKLAKDGYCVGPFWAYRSAIIKTPMVEFK